MSTDTYIHSNFPILCDIGAAGRQVEDNNFLYINMMKEHQRKDENQKLIRMRKNKCAEADEFINILLIQPYYILFIYDEL